MNSTNKQPGPVTRPPFFKTSWFWIGIVVLLGGLLLYVRTWTQAANLDFKPETNTPPAAATPNH